jgi:tRNA U34 5-carboxymethylaminomethyl modifying enzyme MnmG/GidA
MNLIVWYIKNFISYKKEINNRIYSHYSNLEVAQLQQYVTLGQQGLNREDLLKQSGYFVILEKEFNQLKLSYNHDLKFIMEAVMANHLPLKLVLFIDNDSISSVENEQFKIYIVLSDSSKTEILNPKNLEIVIPKNLDYSSINHLSIKYRGNLYEFFKPLFEVSNSANDSTILANVNSLTNNLVKDSFENKLFWYVNIDKSEISLKLKSRQIEKLKN